MTYPKHIQQVVQTVTAAEEDHLTVILSKYIEIEGCNHNEAQEVYKELRVAHTAIGLDFEALAGFDEFNLMHDINGIRDNVNMDTFEFDNCFHPQCADRRTDFDGED